jgi:hypothetical protein
MATYAEPIRGYEAVLSDSGNISYENVTVGAGADLVSGAVIGMKKFVQAAAPIPTIVGTGTGLMTALTFGPDVQVGSYVITLTATSATAAFSVVAPDGTALPAGAVGTAYKSTHLSFLISNGGTMTLGDTYTVVVSASGTPVLVGTGTGTVSGVSLGKYAQLGTYRVKLTATSATALFEVQGPNGLVGTGNVATAFASDHVNFTLANGGTMTLGDYFNIVVANQANVTGRYYAYDPTAVDGTQEPMAVLVQPAAAASVAVSANAVARLAEVKLDKLTWKTNVSAAQKIAAAKQLAANSTIVVRS